MSSPVILSPQYTIPSHLSADKRLVGYHLLNIFIIAG
jgi:hypothetical protein